MLRGLMLLIFLAAIGLLAFPFFMTSRALDAHGIVVPGNVYHKSEWVRLRYSDWELLRDATIEYSIPESGSVSFFTIHPDVQQYDAMHEKQAVKVRYLLRRDIPDVPLAGVMADMHLLPRARVLGLNEVPRLGLLQSRGAVKGARLLGLIIVLAVLWRITRWRPFAWATGAGVAAGIAFFLIHDFPRPTPPPLIDVRQGFGLVKSIELIDSLFSGQRERGWIAAQPMDVVAVEFVPQGRTEPVVAADVIDRGSVPGLREQARVPIRYEAASPRNAYIEGATRTFPDRNLSGIISESLMGLAVLVGLWAIVQWIGRMFRQWLAR